MLFEPVKLDFKTKRNMLTRLHSGLSDTNIFECAELNCYSKLYNWSYICRYYFDIMDYITFSSETGFVQYMFAVYLLA